MPEGGETGPAPALPTPEIDWGEDGPRSARFADGYHGAADGLAEAMHVFVDGNDLPARFARLRPGAVFTLGELGFGTGTNVLAAMTAWAARGHADGHLWIVSVEGYPLARTQMEWSLREARARWPMTAHAADTLSRVYPDPVPGQTTLRLGRDVTLTLLLGEADAVLRDADFSADAWFLDGFSPRTNPAMWTVDLMRQVAARSRPDATAATFTVAGAVRRALTAAGFGWAKRDGFGRKRECLTAKRTAPSPGTAPAVPAPPRIGVVGAGIAGACVAEAARRLGAAVQVFDPAPASGASGNPGGLITPRIQAADDAHARLYRDAYLYAGRFYADACPEAIEILGADVAAEPQRVAKVLALGIWPVGELLATPEGLHAPHAALLRPADAVRCLLGDTDPVRRAPTLARGADGWTLDGEAFGAVVVTAGAATPLVLGAEALGPGLSARRGQIDWFEGAPPQRIASGDGYAAPLGPLVLAGATYAAAAFGDAPIPTTSDTAANAETAQRLTGETPGSARGARAALRLAARDRHPVAGPLADGPCVLTALGSRGLLTAPLLAADIASALTGAPRPLPRSQQQAVSASRFTRS